MDFVGSSNKTELWSIILQGGGFSFVEIVYVQTIPNAGIMLHFSIHQQTFVEIQSFSQLIKMLTQSNEYTWMDWEEFIFIEVYSAVFYCSCFVKAFFLMKQSPMHGLRALKTWNYWDSHRKVSQPHELSPEEINSKRKQVQYVWMKLIVCYGCWN